MIKQIIVFTIAASSFCSSALFGQNIAGYDLMTQKSIQLSFDKLPSLDGLRNDFELAVGNVDKSTVPAANPPRIEIPPSNNPFNTSIKRGTTQEYYTLSGSTAQPASVGLGLIGAGAGDFDLDIQNVFLVAIAGNILVYQINFAWKALPTADLKTYQFTLASRFFNGSGGVLGGADRENVFVEVTGAGGPSSAPISFVCDMTYEIASGRFTPGEELSVRGDFNGWVGTDIMSQVAGTTVWTFITTKTFALGQTVQYKFAYEGQSGTIWEQGVNREYTVTQTDLDNSSAVVKRVFDDASPNDFTGQQTTIKFALDMKNAVDVNGAAFASIDKVGLVGSRAPLLWPAAGWPDSDANKVIFLNDNGVDGDEIAGDNVWSRDVVFPQFTGLDVAYKYSANFGLSSNNGTNDNEAGFLVDQKLSRGTHSVTWRGRDARGRPVASGVYLYRLQTGSLVESRKMLLLR